MTTIYAKKRKRSGATILGTVDELEEEVEMQKAKVARAETDIDTLEAADALNIKQGGNTFAANVVVGA